MPAISVLIVSHNKQHLLREAVDSVLRQTFTDWQAILIDSGPLYDRGFFDQFPWAKDHRFRFVKSGETPEMRRHKAMAPWCFNECFRRGWVQGDLVMYLCDDDILYLNAFATFVDRFRQRPDAMAMYASQDVGWIGADGRCWLVGERRARTGGGRCCRGRVMDCQVDYLQLCHRAAALQAFPDDEYWPEELATADHADGIFMERLGSYYPILPVDVKVGQNRRTACSTYVPIEDDGGATGPPADFRAAGDFEPDSSTILEDWAALAELINAGPAAAANFSVQPALADFERRLRRLCAQHDSLRLRLGALRYRLVERLCAFIGQIPLAWGVLRWLVQRGGRRGDWPKRSRSMGCIGPRYTPSVCRGVK
jgi:hypothetical protein